MDGKNLNSRFAADVAHLCKLSVRHVGAHLGCEISCRYVAISTVPSFKYFFYMDISLLLPRLKTT